MTRRKVVKAWAFKCKHGIRNADVVKKYTSDAYCWTCDEINTEIVPVEIRELPRKVRVSRINIRKQRTLKRAK